MNGGRIKHMVKSSLHICYIIILLFSKAFGQGSLTPTSDEALIILKVLNPIGSPFKNADVTFKNNEVSKFTATTNNQGILKILLPIGNQYSVNCGDSINERLIYSGDRGYSTWSGTRYTYRFIDFTFNFRDYQDRQIDKETISIVLSSGDTLIEETDKYGDARFFIPIKSSFTVYTEYNLVKSFTIPDEGYESISFEFNYQGESSKAIEKQKKEARLAQVEYERYQTTLDSIRAHEDSIRSTQPTSIIFFASSAIVSDQEMRHPGEISVFDGGKEGVKIGSLNSIWSCHSGPSLKDAEIILEKTKGTHSYYAKSSQGFEWEGDYEITGGGWKHIILEISEGKIAAN